MKKRVGHKGAVPLAVGAVRNIEKLLLRVSRKRKLAADERQKLKKYATYLKRKRNKAAMNGRVVIPQRKWRLVLRVLAEIVKHRAYIAKVFAGLLGKQ